MERGCGSPSSSFPLLVVSLCLNAIRSKLPVGKVFHVFQGFMSDRLSRNSSDIVEALPG